MTDPDAEPTTVLERRERLSLLRESLPVHVTEYDSGDADTTRLGQHPADTIEFDLSSNHGYEQARTYLRNFLPPTE